MGETNEVGSGKDQKQTWAPLVGAVGFQPHLLFGSRLLLFEALMHASQPPLGSASATIYYNYQSREVGRLGGINTFTMRKVALASGSLPGYSRCNAGGNHGGAQPHL